MCGGGERGEDGREKSHCDKPQGREVEKRKGVSKLFKGTGNQWQVPFSSEFELKGSPSICESNLQRAHAAVWAKYSAPAGGFRWEVELRWQIQECHAFNCCSYSVLNCFPAAAKHLQ